MLGQLENREATDSQGPTPPLEMDDNRRDDGNEEPGAQYHLLNFHHRDRLPRAENQYEKNGRGSDGFDLCVTEYPLGEYHQKIERPGSWYEHTCLLLLPFE